MLWAWSKIVRHEEPIIHGVPYGIGGNSYRDFGPPGGGLFVPATTTRMADDLKQYEQYYDLERYLFDIVRVRFEQTKKLTLEDILLIGTWKSPQPIHHFVKGFKACCDDVSKLSTILADYQPGLEETARRVLDRLVTNREIRGLGGIPMASAFLTVLYPEHFTIIDWRVKETFELRSDLRTYFEEMRGFRGRDNPVTNVSAYLRYVALCKRAQQEMGFPSLRSFDKALWAFSFHEGIRRRVYEVQEECGILG